MSSPKTYPLIYVDRSRIQAYLDCKRLRYLRYHYPDPETGRRRGLQPVQKAKPLVNGSFIHKAIELHLTGTPLDDAIAYATGAYLLEVGKPAEACQEQLCLLEGLVRAWVRYRLPRLLEEYEVVSVEEELEWRLDCQLIDMVKCDVLLRRRSDGLVFILEFKTTKRASYWWKRQWEHNTQVLANTQAIQEVLGETVGGMLIEGLVKGADGPDTAKSSPWYGQDIQHSPLCYIYKDEVDGEVVYFTEYRRGAQKVAVWEEMTPKEWVEMLTGDELEKLFCPVPPLKPRALDLQRWKRQTLAQELEVAGDLERIDAALEDGDDETAERLLDELFPKNDSACFRYFGHPCPMEPLCFTSEVERDPIGSGKYEWRVPHHEQEDNN